jgi:hypothetical protein
MGAYSEMNPHARGIALVVERVGALGPRSVVETLNCT